MYDWIKNSSLVEYCGEEERMDFDRPDFEMEKLKVMEPPTTMTALAQYFTAGSI